MSTPAQTCSAPGCPRPARAKGCCTAHYQQQRRRAQGVEPARAMPGAVMLAPIRLDAREDMLVAAAAALEGVSVAEWVRGAIRQRLMREAVDRPELRRLGDDVLGVVHVGDAGGRMTDAELREIEERAATALPGPWTLVPAEWQPTRGGQIWSEPPGGERRIVAVFEEASLPYWPEAFFMARAREDVSALVAEVRRLRALLPSETQKGAGIRRAEEK